MTTIATAFRSHPDRSALVAYFDGALQVAGEQRVEEHLRAGCLRCLMSLREYLSQLQGQRRAEGHALLSQGVNASANDEELASYLSRVERKALLIEAEKLVAPGLMAELMLRPPSNRRVLVREGLKYQLLLLSEALREESSKEVFRDLGRALELADLSAEVADCLDTTFYGRRIVADARALAWAGLGNCRRVAGDFFGAERSFQAALDFLERGTGSPTEEAEILSLLASLRTEQARFKEAIRLLEKSASTYRGLALPHLEGKALFKLGHTAIAAGEPDRALELFQSALDLLDEEQDSKLVFWAHHNIAACLSDSGAHGAAQEYLDRIAPLYAEFPDDRAIHLRRRWLEGRIAAGLHQLEKATSILGEIRSLFIEEDRAFDHALVSLDLASVYLESGQIDEVRRLVLDMYPIFRSQDIHREAIAALLLFERAVAADSATAALAQDISRYLNRARNNPYLRYEPTKPYAD